MKIITDKTRKSLFYLAMILVLLWIGFGPVQLGGPVSYIVISGSSMEPEIFKGDLVVTRKSDGYQVDQRVVYDHPTLGFVFHRIVDQEGDRFILKGDNNDWLDTYQPSQEEILGKFWYIIPGAGKTLVTLRQPLFFGIFIVITSSMLAGLILVPDPNSGRRKKGKRKRMKKENSPLTIGDFRHESLLALGIIAAIAFILSLIALNRDSKIIVKDDLSYKHITKLEYSASAAGDIYDGPGVTTGDPVYPALSCNIDFDFSYQFSSPRLTGADQDQFAGEISLNAEVRDNDGWHRTIPLVPESQFSTLKVNAQPSLDICNILEMIQDKEIKTDLDIKIYTLSILPKISIGAELEGLAVYDEFLPTFTFDLSDAVFRVPYNGEGLQIEQEGFVPHEFKANNVMGILGKQVSVIAVRWTAFGTLGICLLAGLYIAWPIISDLEKSERSWIEIQHRPVMIDLKDSQIRKEKYTLIDLETMGDLRKLADRYGAMIMHEVEGNTHYYLIVDEDFIYQFQTEEEAAQLNSSEMAEKEPGKHV